MKHLVLSAVLSAVSLAAPQGYDLSSPQGTSFSHGGGRSPDGCNLGEVRHVDGRCVLPVISRNLFVYDAPRQPQSEGGGSVSVPPPRVNHNILLVRLPEGGAGSDPIIVPPPRQESIIYVLSKNSGGGGGQRVIEVTPPPPSHPEVFFVNYDEGENPTLPIGVDLQTALRSAAQTPGQVISGAPGGGSATGSTFRGSTGGNNGGRGGNVGGRGGNIGGRGGFGNNGGGVILVSGSRSGPSVNPSNLYASP